MKALIINAHQLYKGFSEGRLNQSFVDVALETLTKAGWEVKTTHIEKGYNIEEEITKHEWADLVITQTPSNWFSAPWMHKKYIDEVFTVALGQSRLVKSDGRTRSDATKQYGTGGLSQGKKYLLSTTWNAPLSAFGDANQWLLGGKTEDDVFLHITSTYKFCGYEILEGFHAHDVMKNPTIEETLKRFEQRVKQIAKG